MSSAQAPHDLIPIELLEHLNKGDCVLFVGDELDGQSQGQRLATVLVDRGQLHSDCPVPTCQAQGRCDKPGQCAIPFHRAAQLYQSRRGRFELVRCVRDFVEEHYSPQLMSPILRAVASLPAHTMITTAYDRRLEEALRQAGRRVNAIVRDANVSLDDPGSVQLIYLRGRLDQPDESLTLTSDDAADLFGRLPTVATILRGLFASKTLLFLGYSLADPYFDTLYQQVSRPIGSLMRAAYGVQWPANALAVERWRGKIDLAQIEPLDYLKALSGRVRIQAQISQAGKLPPAPYKFLDYFTETDQAIFFGRDLEVDLLLSTILAHRLSVFYGCSGTGKTSLLLAKAGPELKVRDYKVVYARMLGDPATEVKAAVRGVKADELAYADRSRRLVDVLADAIGPTDRLVIILDQFEEFFVRQGEAVRRAFAQELRDCLWPTSGLAGEGGFDLRVVLSLRDDYLGSLDELTGVLPHDVFAHRYRIQNLDAEKATLAIIKPAEQFGLPVEEALCQRLVGDLEDRGVEPANLQIVLHELYQDARREGLWDEQARQGVGLTLERYRTLGRTAAILASYLDRVLAELEAEQQEQARTILKSMVTAQRTKAAITGKEIVAGDLVARLHVPVEQVQARLAFLRNRGVVRKFGDEDRYELAHEVMVEKVWQWVGEDDLRLLDVRDMLRRAMSDYDKFGHLLDESKLALLDSYRDALALEAAELEFLFRSALAAGYETPYWRGRAPAVVGRVEEELFGELMAEQSQQANKAVARLVTLASPEIVERLVALVDGEHCGGPVTWIDHQGKNHAIRNTVLNLQSVAQRRAVLALAKMTLPEATAALGRWTPPGMMLIPAGSFTMGSTEYSNEGPVHEVWLDAFWIDRYPVTNAQWAAFLAADPWRKRELWSDAGWEWREIEGSEPTEWRDMRKKLDHPVRYVCWYESLAYARWVGKDLASEAQWEKAARGTDGRRYPWSDTFDKNRCNTSEAGIGDTTSVGKYSKAGGDSPYGVADVAGNVWQWTRDLYRPYPYRTDDGRGSLEEPGNRVLRGGSFLNYERSARCAGRDDDYAGLRLDHLGLRVCVSPGL